MKFTLVGHAGLYVESDGVDLLVDPWLTGSCYWRSWWHYPPIDRIDERWLSTRFIYLSHHHFDHFHYPSLRMIDRHAQVLVPRFGVDVMRSELAGLGFHRVTELAHGEPMGIGGGMTVRSYQYGVDDSALVIEHGDTVVVDLNDCKVRGPALSKILGDVGRPTFLLKNYSAAQAYPGCYTAANPKDLQLISRESYAEDFIQTAAEVRPRYAVPFASMTCFLHPETAARNADVVLPAELVAAAEHQPTRGVAVTVMVPGDSWDEQGGFDLDDGDPYVDFTKSVAALEEKVRPIVDVSLAEEGERELDFDAFSRYFGEFVDALPWGANRLFKGSMVFAAPEGARAPFWVVDPRRRQVRAADALPDDWAAVVTVPPGVLADAMEKRIVNFVHISMRITVQLNDGGADTDFLFWGVLTVWELGYLPLRRLQVTRILSVAWARRRELTGGAWRQITGSGSSVERMAATFMPAGTSAAESARAP